CSVPRKWRQRGSCRVPLRPGALDPIVVDGVPSGEASFELASSAAAVDAAGVSEPGEVHAADDAVRAVLAAVPVVPGVGAVRLGQPLARAELAGSRGRLVVFDALAGWAVVVAHDAFPSGSSWTRSTSSTFLGTPLA